MGTPREDGEQKLKVVFVGAGNVGLQAIMTFAPVQRGVRAPWRMFVVDYDLVEEKDVRKGFHRQLVGRFKAEAAVDMVRILYGEETASAFIPVVAAAQSVPGLIREADAVFSGVDSSLAAAYVSEEARHAWEVRMTTAIHGVTATHTLEVMPKGFTLGEVSYDSAAWADAARHECRLGTPENSFAGIAQPFGAVTAALAVQLFLAKDGSDGLPRMIRVAGAEIFQSRWSQDIEGIVCESEEIAFSYDQSLAMLCSEVAFRLGVAAEDVLLVFPIPLVTRQCSNRKHGVVYRGFERQPVWGLCGECGEETYCLEAVRETALKEVRDIAQRSLGDLFAPAGLRFQVLTRDGRGGTFHMPFRLEDVPCLPHREVQK